MNDTRGQNIHRRLIAIGIPKTDFADRAGIDRSTVDRVIADDPKVRATTWAKVENALDAIEDELGVAESGNALTATIEFRGAKITMAGSIDDVTKAVHSILSEDRD